MHQLRLWQEHREHRCPLPHASHGRAQRILSSSYTSVSRVWRTGRAEERYPTRRASVFPLQVVERRLGLSWLSWLHSLESKVLARNCADFLPYLDVTRQQLYRDVNILVSLSRPSFQGGNSRRCRTTQSLPCLKPHHPRHCRSLWAQSRLM